MTTDGRQQRFTIFAESCIWKCEAFRANRGSPTALRLLRNPVFDFGLRLVETRFAVGCAC
jgi:hypothetical protein